MKIIFNPPFAFPGPRRIGPKPYALELQQRLLMVSNSELQSEPEWTPLTREEREPYLGPFRAEAMIYSPRIDLAVGPFATEWGLAGEFDGMLERHRGLVQRLLEAHGSNMRVFPD